MDQTLCNAISNRNCLRIVYDWGYRVVEPHCYGFNEKGHELLRAYQTGGESKSYEPVGWKLFRVDEINQIAVLTEQFSGARPGYNRNDPVMTGMIYCEL